MSRGGTVGGQRSNYHFGYPFDSASDPEHTKIHIFDKENGGELMKDLAQELVRQRITHKFHNDSNEFGHIITMNTQKTLVLISTEDGPEGQPVTVFPKGFTFPYPNETLKFYTFPRKLPSSGLNNLASVQDVVEFSHNYWTSNPRRIKLAEVHSIRGSRDKPETSKSLRKVITHSTYEGLLLLKENDSYQNAKSMYGELVEALEEESNCESFQHFSFLEKKSRPGRDKKYLVMCPTSEKGFKVAHQLRKKSDYFEVMLLGDLKPDAALVHQSVILASPDPLMHLQFLSENGFQSFRLNKTMGFFKQNRASQTRIEASPEMNSAMDVVAGIFGSIQAKPPEPDTPQIRVNDQPHLSDTHKPNMVSSGVMDKIMNNIEEQYDMKRSGVKGDSQLQPEKKKIKKIKSPTKSKIASEVKSPTGSEVRINVLKESDKGLPETEDYRYNKQGQKIIKQISVEETPTPAPIPAPAINTTQVDVRFSESGGPVTISTPQKHTYDSGISSGANGKAPFMSEHHSLRRSNALDQSYRNPSNVIPETSEEYKGSNKESIMNLEPDARRGVAVNSSSVSGSKKVIVASSTPLKGGEIYTSTGQDKYVVQPRSPTNNNVKHQVSDAYSSTSERKLLSNGANVISERRVSTSTYGDGTGPRVITAHSGTAGVRTYGRVGGATAAATETYQSPSKVVRKTEVVEPEQVRNGESATTLNNRITFGKTGEAAYYGSTAKKEVTGGYTPPYETGASAYQGYTTTSYSPRAYSKDNYYSVKSISRDMNQQNGGSGKKVEITTGKTEDVTTKHDKNGVNGHIVSQSRSIDVYSSPSARSRDPTTVTTGLNMDDYERVEKDGTVYYRKKVPVQATKTTVTTHQGQIRYGSPQPISEPESPKVHQYGTAYQRESVRNPTTTYTSTAVHKEDHYKPSSYRASYSSTYGEDANGLGQMIESSYKKRREDSNGLSYKVDDGAVRVYGQSGTKVYGESPSAGVYGGGESGSRRVYGQSPRVQVERTEYYSSSKM